MAAEQNQIHRLRQLAGACGEAVRAPQAMVSTGHAGIDAELGGGVARGRLHEIHAAQAGDGAGAAAFASLLARQLGGAAIWLREERAARRFRLHAPGLAALGFDPARLLLAVLPDADAVLRAAADVLRCPGVGAAVIELWRNPRNLGLTSTRRFQLAAEASGVTPLLLRIDAAHAPTAAATRWAVRSIASRPMEANAPGYPAFELELLRHRGGGSGCWRLEWHRDSGRLRDLPAKSGAPPSGAVVSVPADGASQPIPFRRAG